MKLFPPWTRMKNCVATTEDLPDLHACYDFEQSKTILKLDLDLQLKLGKLDSCLKDKVDFKLALKKLEDANTLLHGNIGRLEIRLQEKDQVLTDNTHLMVKYQKRDVFGGALPWVIAVVVVVAGAAFAGGYYLGSR
jgi:hypothetical protein